MEFSSTLYVVIGYSSNKFLLCHIYIPVFRCGDSFIVDTSAKLNFEVDESE